MLDRFLKRMMMFDANDGAGSGGGDNSGAGGDGGSGGTNNDGGDPGKDAKTFTQEDLDKQIGARLARERKKWETDQADAKKQADMTEAEKLKAAIGNVLKDYL